MMQVWAKSERRLDKIWALVRKNGCECKPNPTKATLCLACKIVLEFR